MLPAPVLTAGNTQPGVETTSPFLEHRLAVPPTIKTLEGAVKKKVGPGRRDPVTPGREGTTRHVIPHLR
jgi:hypothetical protein